MTKEQKEPKRFGAPPAWVLALSEPERVDRATAAFLQIPRVCHVRACRRSHFCLGPAPVTCLSTHPEYAGRRWAIESKMIRSVARRRAVLQIQYALILRQRRRARADDADIARPGASPGSSPGASPIARYGALPVMPV